MKTPTPFPVSLLLLALAPLASAAQSTMSHHGTQGIGSGPDVPLYGDLGDLTRPLVTATPEAQRYFDQGLRLTYGFGHPEAIRSFQEAQRLDPQCAMCFWGEAWARGPYINAGMDSISGIEAWKAARRAIELAPGRTAPVEASLIEAMGHRYEEIPTSANRARLDSAYARAMRAVAVEFPDDPEATVLHAEALMVLRPWDHWTREGRPQPGTEEVLSALEAVLERDLRHPGACHLYIHATEASPDPGRAAPCAEFLGDRIPGASHIPHMPSHTWVRVGRWGDAVRANQRAVWADLRASKGGAPGIYPTHNLHMLAFAASYDGQSSVAIQAARDLARISGGSGFYTEVFFVRFGRWAEILELDEAPAVLWQRGVRAFSRGMALLRTGDPAGAGTALAGLRAVRDSLPAEARFRGHPQRALLDVAGSILEGEILADAGSLDAAVEVLEQGLPIEDGLDYDEPEPWPIPIRHVLGAVLLQAGRAAEAGARYREDLRHHPGNGWSLFGLAQSLEVSGREEEAAEARARFERAWPRADLWITSSRY